MKLKTKIFSLVTTLMLLLCLLIVGVWAIKNADFSVTGNITFKATGVEATITCTGLENATLNNGTVGEDKLTDIKIDTSLPKGELLSAFYPWQSLSLSFVSDSNIEINLRIKNDNLTSNYINADVSVHAATMNNCIISAFNNVDGSTSAMISPGEYQDYSIVFSLVNPKEDASLSGFVIDFNLKHTTLSNISSASSYSDSLTITCDEETATASVRKSNSNITSAIIPDYVLSANGVICKVNEIEDAAFSYCTALTTISIPSTIQYVGGGAFLQSNSISYNDYQNGKYLGNDENPYIILESLLDYTVQTFQIHNDCVAICNNAFDSSSITNLTIPCNVKDIGASAFWKCTKLESILIPRIKAIKASTFAYCQKLSNIVLLEGLTEIQNNAFSYCTALTTISVPSTMEFIGSDVFTDCVLETTSYDNANYLGNSKNPYVVLYSASSSASSITIHDDCRVIYSKALSDCDKITNIKIPANIKSIGDSAFYGLFLKNIYIHSSYIASALSGKTADICGGLLRYFENLWIRTSVYDFLNAYVKNTFKAGDNIVIGEREYYLYKSGYTIY